MNYQENISEAEQTPLQGGEDRRVWIVIGVLAVILIACICVFGLVISYFLFLDEGSPTQPGPVEPVPVPPEQIQNINWQWAELTQTEPAGQSLVPEAQDYTLVFQPGGQFSFRADCNVGSGTYTMDGGNVTLQLGPVTMAECGPASMSNEFMGLLGSVATYGVEGGRLVLGLKENVGHMIFDNSGPAQAVPVEPPEGAIPAPQLLQPTATMGVLPLAIPRFPPEAGVGEDVTLDGSQSQPGSSPLVSYKWEFGDGTSVDGVTVAHAYTAPGVYAVTLAVAAEDGLGSSATGQIVVTEVQSPEPTPTRDPAIGLVGPTWRWSELIEEGEPSIVPNPQNYTLGFEPDLTLRVTADCNSGAGTYAVDGARIRLDLGGISQDECGPDSLSEQYLALLRTVDEYELDEGLLLLYPAEDADRMILVP